MKKKVAKIKKPIGIREYFALLFILTIVLFIAYQYIVQNPKASKAEKELVIELENLYELPYATRLNYFHNHKTSNALVESNYVSSSSYNEIRKFYLSEAKRNGWKFIKESNVKIWGRYLGGKHLEFRKGEYFLGIQYAGKKENYRWTYSVALSWKVGQ